MDSDIALQTDEELAHLAQNDDLDALNGLLYRYKTAVKGAARQFFLVGGETEDLAQEGMIALYNAVMTYDIGRNASFKTFATMCVKRQIYDAIKSSLRPKNKIHTDSLTADGDISTAPSDENDPEALYLEEESFSALIEKIKEALTVFESNVLSMYLDGLSYAEIAQDLNVSVKKTDNTLQKIKRTLKKLVKD